MNAAHALHHAETPSPHTYLRSLAARFPALAPILDQVGAEPFRAPIEDVLADALSHLPYFPDPAPESAPVAAASREDVVRLELGWLACEIGWLRSCFESAVFRRFAGAGRREERDAARYYLALIARLYRLDLENRSAVQAEEAVA